MLKWFYDATNKGGIMDKQKQLEIIKKVLAKRNNIKTCACGFSWVPFGPQFQDICPSCNDEVYELTYDHDTTEEDLVGIYLIGEV